MRRLACSLLLLVFAAAPAGAADATPEAVLAAYDSLIGQAEQRDVYALPPKRFWRATGAQRVVVSGGRDLNPGAMMTTIANDFSAATGVAIGVEAVAKPGLPEYRDLNSLHVVIAGRPLGARLAAEVGVDSEMRQRFHGGAWPALFRFRRDDLSGGGARKGVVILADDLSPAEIEIFLGVSMVWAMGGASLGEELRILNDPGGRPGLTDLGRKVFALMYRREFQSGMKLDEARATAQRILGLPE